METGSCTKKGRDPLQAGTNSGATERGLGPADDPGDGKDSEGDPW